MQTRQQADVKSLIDCPRAALRAGRKIMAAQPESDGLGRTSRAGKRSREELRKEESES